MINIKRAFLPLLLPLFLPVPEAHSAAEEGNVEFFPIAMVADREETLLVCGNYYADQSNENKWGQ
jgi:hypothetical protein